MRTLTDADCRSVAVLLLDEKQLEQYEIACELLENGDVATPESAVFIAEGDGLL
jgi:hypothetical protein